MKKLLEAIWWAQKLGGAGYKGITDGMIAVSQNDGYSGLASLKPAGWVWVGHNKETKASTSTSV